MLTVRHLANSTDSGLVLKFKLLNGILEVSSEPYGDTSVELSSYCSYFLTKIEDQLKFYDLLKLGYGERLQHYGDTWRLSDKPILAQIDTGMICYDPQRSDLYLTIRTNKENIEIDSSDVPHEFMESDLERMKVYYPRKFVLWDMYRLETNGKIFEYNEKGVLRFGDNSEPLVPDENGVLTFTIHKVHPHTKESLTRDIDDDVVTVECSCGVVDTRMVILDDGIGTFKVHTLGYKGIFYIKLGRRFYPCVSHLWFHIGE